MQSRWHGSVDGSSKQDRKGVDLTSPTQDADGAVSVQFGGCDGSVPNCLPTTPNWSYMVRLYRPRAQVLDGRWKFPEAEAVQ